MIVVKYLLSVLLYLLMLPVSSLAAYIVPLFTREQPVGMRSYSWGGWFGTYDNPPQGDYGWISKRCMYPMVTTGLRGYVNRVGWMRRNRLYGLKRWLSVPWSECDTRTILGSPDVSDKYKVKGCLFASARGHGSVNAFELYAVYPWSETRCLRVRLGWKIKGDKFDEAGEFAPMVFTINPFDSWGDNDARK